MNEATISIRAFAALYNLTDTAIRHYIKCGYITSASIVINPKNKRPGLIAEKAVEEIRKNYNSEFGVNMVKSRPGRKSDQEELGTSLPPNTKHVVVKRGEETLSDIKIQVEKVKLEKERILLEEKKGELISRDLVNKALYEKGKDVRIKMQSIAAREIDDILAAGLKSRQEAKKKLEDAIDAQLLKIGDISEFKIKRV